MHSRLLADDLDPLLADQLCRTGVGGGLCRLDGIACVGRCAGSIHKVTTLALEGSINGNALAVQRTVRNSTVDAVHDLANV